MNLVHCKKIAVVSLVVTTVCGFAAFEFLKY